MKILYLTTGCFDKGGVSRFSRYQASALRETFGDANVKVLSLLGPDDHAFEEPFEVTWNGSKFGMLDKLRMVLQTIKLALFWRPHLIVAAHLHLSPLVHVVSRCVGAKSHLNVYGLEVWSKPSRACLWALKSVDSLIADCHSTANYVKENRLRDPSKIHVVWDCVDVDRFQPHECPKTILEKYNLYSPNEHFVILTLGRLSKAAAHKGYDRLISVFSKIYERYPNARLVICGRGDNADSLKKQCEDLGVSDRVRFPGAVDEADLADVYCSGTIFSLVSDRGEGRGEGIPMTPLEAMAAGLPIVVGNQDGSSEAIHGTNGFVVDSFDLDEHAERVSSLIDNPKLLAEMSQSARRVAVDVFSYERFVREHQSIFRNT